MNAQENAVAQEILNQIKTCSRTEPEKAKHLSEA